MNHDNRTVGQGEKKETGEDWTARQNLTSRESTFALQDVNWLFIYPTIC